MDTKYSLKEIKKMLKETSFYGCAYGKYEIYLALEILELAIEHHHRLDRSNDGEGF